MTRKRQAPTTYIPLSTARGRLAGVWLIGSGLIFLVLMLQSLRRVYGPDVREAWEWLFPTVMPTLSLIVSVIGYAASHDDESTSVGVRKNYLRLTVWLSVCYLLMVAATILMQPLTPMDRLELMRTSNIWLGPFQGLVASALGVLFFTVNRSTEPAVN